MVNFIRVDVCTLYHRTAAYVSQASIAKDSLEVTRGDPNGDMCSEIIVVRCETRRGVNF